MVQIKRVNTFIGSPVDRVEDLRFLRGRGEYVGDLPHHSVWHAAILRSSVAHGGITSVDVSEALKIKGIRGVITARDIGEPVPKIAVRLGATPDLARFEQPVIAHRKVRYVGEPIAVVVADTPHLAEDALEAIQVDIEPLPEVSDRNMAVAETVLLFEEQGTNVATRFNARRGDPDAIFASADYTRRERFSVHRHTAMPMETRGVLAAWNSVEGRMKVSGASKVAFFNRKLLAKTLRLSEDDIDLVENDVGGGFGVRGEFYPEDFLIPFAAKHLQGSVMWIEDRREHFIASNHARDVVCEMEIACARDGKILGLRGTACADMGAYIRTNGAMGPLNVAQVMTGPYRVPNFAIEVTMALTNKTPVGTYRAPGRFEADFVRERLLDLAADDLNIDRVELRRRNLLSESELPHALVAVAPYNNISELDSGDYGATLDRCLDEFCWAEKQQVQGRLVDGLYHGLGICCYIEGGGLGPKENARLVLDDDGLISVFVGSSALGQGLETIFAQIAADALEVPMGRIRGVFHGSTHHVTEGFGSYSGRATVMGGSAIVVTAAQFKDAIRTAAAKRLKCDPSTIRLSDDCAVAESGAFVPLAELASEVGSIEASFLCEKRTYSYGAHAVHVTVDSKTGQVDVLDYLAVEDVGRIINPATLHGQAIGAIVQGLGGTLLEELCYDKQGQLLTGSFADYAMPAADSFPYIRTVALELRPAPHNPLGAKGAGEGGIIPVGGLIANAVAAALASLGVEPLALPLSPPKLWELIRAAQAKSR